LAKEKKTSNLISQGRTGRKQVRIIKEKPMEEALEMKKKTMPLARKRGADRIVLWG